MTIVEARKVLGDDANKYSDPEMQMIIDLYYAMSNLIIDCYLEVKNEKTRI